LDYSNFVALEGLFIAVSIAEEGIVFMPVIKYAIVFLYSKV